MEGNPPLTGEDLRVAEWIWRQGHNSVSSFARYLERHVDHTDLTLYVCWEREEGKPLDERHRVRPSFFGGPSFERLPENSLYTIVKEGDEVAVHDLE
jgi:hypothetical protein